MPSYVSAFIILILVMFICFFSVFIMYLRSRPIVVNTENMNLVSREEFQTAFGTAIRETYEDGKRMVTVTAFPPDPKEERK